MIKVLMELLIRNLHADVDVAYWRRTRFVHRRDQ
jgi:hypothetical protein